MTLDFMLSCVLADRQAGRKGSDMEEEENGGGRGA
ncbi:hypothetical protein CGMCC3_g7909 [Colletotrichum fructicola]|nr:uncharacterized protein CGMCC3_g7909 [Colletotrichum fructicola]KAE9576263.1 hypothetical protein CGMCC3_g7909 [Colletotrichum fructicola]